MIEGWHPSDTGDPVVDAPLPVPHTATWRERAKALLSRMLRHRDGMSEVYNEGLSVRLEQTGVYHGLLVDSFYVVPAARLYARSGDGWSTWTLGDGASILSIEALSSPKPALVLAVARSGGVSLEYVYLSDSPSAPSADHYGLFVGSVDSGSVGWSRWDVPVLAAAAVDIPGQGPMLAVIVQRSDGPALEYIPLTDDRE